MTTTKSATELARDFYLLAQRGEVSEAKLAAMIDAKVGPLLSAVNYAAIYGDDNKAAQLRRDWAPAKEPQR